MASLDAIDNEAAGAADGAHQPHAMEQTSRIIVKNLPKHVDENRLREHFSAKGEVTDAKVMRTRDGKSRLFGFIGFSSASEAQAAVQYFNKTFLDASRLDVEFAFKYGTSEKPRAWSKYTEGTSAHRRMVEASGANTVALGKGAAAADGEEGKHGKKTKKKKKEPKPEEVDPKLKEFMALMQPRAKQAIWANDDMGITDGIPTAPITAAAANGDGSTPAGVVLEDGDGSDDELYEELPAASEGSDSEEEDGDAAAAEKIKNSLDPVVANTAVSDMDYLKSRMRKNFDDSDSEQAGDEEDNEEGEDEAVSSDEDEDNDEDMEGADDGSEEDNEEQVKEKEDEDDVDAIFKGNGNSTAGDEEEEEQPGGTASKRRGLFQQDEEDPLSIISETGRLFVRNLPYSATEEDLRTAFEAHGELDEVHLVLDKLTRKSKGFALIQFSKPEDAVTAHSVLDGSIFMGRLMHVLPGHRAPGVETTTTTTDAAAAADGAAEGGKSTSSYKKQKEAELKASAGNKVAWNSLFMRADTVAEAVAAHYGVSKSDLLDPNAPDMAVRMALGETQVIAETKTALSNAGVDVEALENAAAAAGKGSGSKKNTVARSDKVLLVKNLPYSAEESELEALFAGMGPVLRLVLPSTKTLALVEFAEPQDARKAFKSLAYKRYQSVPIYLEWAPGGIFNASAQAIKESQKAAAEEEKKKQKKQEKAAKDAQKAAAAKEAAAKPKDVAAELAAGATGDDAVDSSTIYVKNVSFKTEDAAFLEHFTEAVETAGGAVRSARIAKRKSKDGRMLSSGFGFVECSSESVAREVIKTLQGSSLDGHRLVLQLAQGSGKAAGAADNKAGADGAPSKGAMKIVVRNLAFEATRKDILGLFTPFGAVKSCRLPRKFDGSHRGFAFVEFATPQEARGAVEAVSGTHLYGRRLAIEWAEEEGGLDELRAKTERKFRGDEGALMKRGAEDDEESGEKKKHRKK